MPSVVVGEELTKPDDGEGNPEHEEHERACQQQHEGLDETFHVNPRRSIGRFVSQDRQARSR